MKPELFAHRAANAIIETSDVLRPVQTQPKQHWNARAVKYSQLLCPQCGALQTVIGFRKGLAKLRCGHIRGRDINEGVN